MFLKHIQCTVSSLFIRVLYQRMYVSVNPCLPEVYSHNSVNHSIPKVYTHYVLLTFSLPKVYTSYISTNPSFAKVFEKSSDIRVLFPRSQCIDIIMPHYCEQLIFSVFNFDTHVDMYSGLVVYSIFIILCAVLIF
jgi:hypothetical protein